MDHRFYFDPLTDRYEARLEDGLEVIGFWLSSEIGCDRQRLQACHDLLQNSLSEPAQNHTLTGQQYTLTVQHGEVCIQTRGMDAPVDLSAWEDDGLDLYQSESEAWCGVEDLQGLLSSWQAFVPVR